MRGRGSAARRAAGGGSGGRRGAALAVLVLSWGPAFTATALMAFADVPRYSEQLYSVADVMDALVYGLTAAVILKRRSHPVAWLVALHAVGGGVAALTPQLVPAFGGQHSPPPWAVLHGTAWIPGTFALVLIVPYLLSARRLSRPAKAAVAAGVAAIAVALVVRLTTPWPWPGQGEPYSPLAIRDETWFRLCEALQLGVLGAVAVLGSLAAAHTGYRRLRDPSARGLGWLSVGCALVSLTFVPLVIWRDSGGRMTEVVIPLTHLASQAFFPAAVMVVVLGQQLWDIGLTVSRTLVGALLTGLLIATHFGAVAVLGLALPGSDDVLNGVLATAAVAACFQPLRVWLQRRVDRLVHGEAAAPALSRVKGHLSSAATPEEVLTGMAQSVAASFNLSSVQVLGTDGQQLTHAGAPLPGAGTAPIRLPLVVGQRTAGDLLVACRPGERLDRRARASLGEVAPVVASAVQLATVTRELRESRGRLAAARDDERRALRRELHDHLGPALAGIGLGLAAVELRSTEADPLRPLLARLRGELDLCVEDVRVLARGLVPPVLAELGLVEALRELVMRYEADGLAVSVRDRGAAAVPAEVAGTVYAIVAEAIRNVARHSGARTCVAELDGSDVLTVVVEDDGVGIAPDCRPGVGTQSMRERAQEAGGTVSWHPGASGQGTRLVLRVPLRREEVAVGHER
ncbi:ATP-binding protein [Streptomyces sp. NPDC047315]|uniref:sensor histidine kinase n=1 Tax=Streptomyces sp. NPDC047315 TaxID=3155142 RepID=UPI0033F157F2